jgi:threonine efflux protein
MVPGDATAESQALEIAMPPLTPLLSLFAVDFLAILSPGPNILLVTQAAAERSRWHAIVAGLGLTAASLVWAGMALTGLAVLFEMMPSLQTAIRIAGAAYLIYLGIRLWRASPTKLDSAPAETARGAAGGAFVRGFATGLLNPKSLAYFASIFVLFVPADAPIGFGLAAMAIVAFDNLVVYGLAAALFSTPVVRKGYLALRRPIDRACGTLMLVFGAKLMLSRN